MDIQGKIVQILPKQTGEGKNGTWEKQDYILETQAQYPKKVCFSVWGVKIAQYNIQMGEFVSLGVDVESREYNGRWYTDLRAWKVDRPGAAPSNASSSANNTNQEASDPFANTAQVSDPFASSSSSEDADDLPF